MVGLLLFLVVTVEMVVAFAPLQGHVIPTTRGRNLRRDATTGSYSMGDVKKADEKKDVPAKFDWFKAWYPLINVEILDLETPHRFQLLGMDLVVWNDGPTGDGVFGPKHKADKKMEGNWRAFMDECPHRKVPLSEGRIENDGSLMCSYHGWRFDGKGDCISVPQISDTNLEQVVRDNPRTKCHAFPTKVVNGILFVWPSSDENAVLESELTPVGHLTLRENSDRVWQGPWNFRELPYSFDYFVENIVDPAHVAISHHKLAGNRYDPQDIHLELKSPLAKEGFSIETKGKTFESSTRFIAPSLLTVERYEGGAKTVLELYCSPSRPGFCYHVGRLIIPKQENGKTPKFLSDFTKPVPRWLGHILSSVFLNQDALFLHFQERHMDELNQSKPNKHNGEDPFKYTKLVCAQDSDNGVVTFRKWMHHLAGESVPYKNKYTLSAASRDTVFDVWNAHTKYCKYCQDALKRLKKLRFVSFLSAAILAVVRPARLKTIGNVAITLSLAGVGLALNRLIGMFYRYEFSHAHND